MFKGEYYYEDERILRERPHSREAQQIEHDRRTGQYNKYIPKKERASYAQRYGISNNDDKKGGE